MFAELFNRSSGKDSPPTGPSRRSSFSLASTRYDSENQPTVIPDHSRKSSRGSIGRFDTIETVVDRYPEPASEQAEKSAAYTSTHVEVAPSTDGSADISRSWYHPISLFWLAVDNWFLIGIAVFITLAWRWPELGKDGGSESSICLRHHRH